jgi:hypothetical protein
MVIYLYDFSSIKFHKKNRLSLVSRAKGLYRTLPADSRIPGWGKPDESLVGTSYLIFYALPLN